MDYSIKPFLNEDAGCWQVEITGEIDIFNSTEFKNALMGLIKENECDFCLNFKNLDYIDSTALGVLVAVLKSVKGYGGEIYIKEAKPNVAKLFKITNLDKVFILEG